MSVKGGYQILNLQNKDLQYSPTIPGAYEVVEGNYLKPIMISGIVIGGVEKPAVYRQPVVSGSSYIFENVYGYDVTLTDSDGLSLSSTQWATRDYALNVAKFENIVDADGNKRFIEGEGAVASSITSAFSRWSLSGSHLMLVLAGTIADAMVIGEGVTLASFAVPEWVLDKIYPITANNDIELKTISYYSPSDLNSSQNGLVRLVKDASGVSIVQTGGLTTTAERAFRMQFDLLIDND